MQLQDLDVIISKLKKSNIPKDTEIKIQLGGVDLSIDDISIENKCLVFHTDSKPYWDDQE